MSLYYIQYKIATEQTRTKLYNNNKIITKFKVKKRKERRIFSFK